MDTALVVTSPAFENEGTIPVKYTGYGEDISPELHLSQISGQAKSIAIIMDDMNHPIPAYNHWLIWNIPVMSIIPENILPGEYVAALAGAVQGKGYGKNCYKGPKPPFHWSHLYRYTVYVLDTMLELPSSCKKRGLLHAMQGHILQQGALFGRYR